VQCQYERIPHVPKDRCKRGEQQQTTHGPPGSVSNRNETTPSSNDQILEQSRRTSVEPGEIAFDNGLHVGQTSGVSFLYRGGGDRAQVFCERDSDTALSSYGDVPLPKVPQAEYPDMMEASGLLYEIFRARDRR
jgi:hypothetical protein